MSGACKVCQGTTGADDPYCPGCGGGVQVADVPVPEPVVEDVPTEDESEFDEGVEGETVEAVAE